MVKKNINRIKLIVCHKQFHKNCSYPISIKVIFYPFFCNIETWKLRFYFVSDIKLSSVSLSNCENGGRFEKSWILFPFLYNKKNNNFERDSPPPFLPVHRLLSTVVSEKVYQTAIRLARKKKLFTLTKLLISSDPYTIKVPQYVT